jgi:hypothetical protein
MDILLTEWEKVPVDFFILCVLRGKIFQQKIISVGHGVENEKP